MTRIPASKKLTPAEPSPDEVFVSKLRDHGTFLDGSQTGKLLDTAADKLSTQSFLIASQSTEIARLGELLRVVKSVAART